ncbi:unnamed protein product [Aphanomyces euteiches]|uniref:Uncharacterized protein n=1 Tax=Aphanomyces euteiches TaxID=100861 RepID=A0A6G0XMG9_9STRA|nr:hypothetical protein Ae201684_003333 [Aphanomyces euteiches]KAH9098388.1 hypothetical protein Ae201684P_017602 [Aphanomyces euteiches]KAH9157718.1 hypothetical protein AeRB84_000453 [Aphanomyces euteiches]
MEDDDEILFDATTDEDPVQHEQHGNDGNEERIKDLDQKPVVTVDHIAQIARLTEQIRQLQASAAEHNTIRVQAAGENALLQKQLDHQLSVVKHLKQMVKNISDKYTAVQIENRALLAESKEDQAALSQCREEVRQAHDEIARYKSRESPWQETLQRCQELEDAQARLQVECNEWKAQTETLAGVQAENAQLQQSLSDSAREQRIASKRTHHMIKELRHSLKVEQEKNQLEAAQRNDVKVITVDGGSDDMSAAGVIRDMATRLEELLAVNARLKERLQFSQENAQLLAEDLEKKRLVLQQLTLALVAPVEERDEIITTAVAKAAAIESSAVTETLLYVTIKENLHLKRQLGCHKAPFAIEWKEPDGLSFYRML